jgi:glycerophosphoryl diester phosphodiesterase
MIVAHRGNAAEFRENSIPAIRSALELGIKHVEFDVHLSKDGVPMVTHDHTLERLFGVAGNVMDLHSDELRRFGIAPLSDAMMLIRAYGATAFVDLKPESLRRFGRLAIGRVVEHAHDHVLVCWGLLPLFEARREYGVRIGWIVPDLSDKTRQDCERVSPEFLFCDQELIKQPLWPAQWVAYEVSSKLMMDRLKSLGVSYFETMRVRELMNA